LPVSSRAQELGGGQGILADIFGAWPAGME